MPHHIDHLAAQIRAEIDGDAHHLAAALFGPSQPDAVQVPDAEISDMIRTAYLTGDRGTLLKFANQDPLAFLRLARKLGVTTPGEAGGSAPGEGL